MKPALAIATLAASVLVGTASAQEPRIYEAGRYVRVVAVPDEAQIRPLETVVSLAFPRRDISTVGDAARYLLAGLRTTDGVLWSICNQGLDQIEVYKERIRRWEGGSKGLATREGAVAELVAMRRTLEHPRHRWVESLFHLLGRRRRPQGGTGGT